MPKAKTKKFQPINRLRSPMRMANFLLVFAITGMFFLIFASAAYTPGFYGSVEYHQVDRINNTRRANRLNSLQHIECLNAIAEGWTKKMSDANQISHNPNFAAEISYLCGQQWRLVGENVGVTGVSSNLGNDSQSLFNAFMASPGHRANIMGSTYTEVGTGAYVNSQGRLYVTQLFAACKGCSGNWNKNATLAVDPTQAPAPTPTPTAPVCNKQINFVAPSPTSSYDGPTVQTTSTSTEYRYYYYKYSSPSFSSHQISSISPSNSSYTHSDVSGNHGILMNYTPYFQAGINPAQPRINYYYSYRYSGVLWVKRVYKATGATYYQQSSGGTGVTVPLTTTTYKPYTTSTYGPRVYSPCN